MSYFAPYVDETGLHMPTYEDRLADLLSAYRGIFGTDAELSASVPDYQLLSVFAKALDDTSALVLQAFDCMNPLYASGHALDLLAPMYGVARLPGETDAELRARICKTMPAKSAGHADAIRAAVLLVQYVTHCAVYVNDGNTADTRGIPAHNVAVVVRGGAADPLAQAIWEKVSAGVGTYGTASGTCVDGGGASHTVNFTRCGTVQTYVFLTVRRLAGIDEDAVRAALVSAVTAYVNSLDIAQPLIVPRLYAVAYNADPQLAQTFAVSDAYALKAGESAYTRDQVTAAWNQKISTLNQGGVTVNFVD